MRKNRKSTLFAVSWLLAQALLPGCSKPEGSPQATAPGEAPQVRHLAPALAPVQKQLSSASALPAPFDFRNRTDPFKPYAPVAATPAPVQAKGEQPAVPAGDQLPIQSFEVSKFKVAGIIAGLKENRALILDPNGKGYVVQQGMLVGSNNGVISRITASSVEVVERFKDEKGKTRKRTIMLTLAKKR
jgi:type IV pilus assembly protein PilP